MRAALLVLWTAGGSALAEEPGPPISESPPVEEVAPLEEATPAGETPPLGEAALVPPVLLEEVVPAYPPAARDQGVEGPVVVQLAILEDGTVGDAMVVQGPHPLLESAALEAARRLRFEPARQDGQPVAVEILYRFQFDLGLADEQGVAVPGSLHGMVQDPDGLPILDAAITLRSLEDPDFPAIATTTRADGRFHASFLPSGAYQIHLEHPDFHFTDAEVAIAAGQNLRRAFTLVPADVYQVTVFYDQRTWREVERGALDPNEGTVTGSYVLTRRDIEVNPGSLEDAARAVHSLPGVVADGDMLASFHARGGETSEVVFLLDRVPLQNPYHLAGFNSLFNPDMISRIDFTAGAAPADVPAGTSAVMAVETWDGSPRQDGTGMDGAIDISASSLRALVMGPLGPENAFALAVRRSYLESYMQVMKWANIVDTAFAAPEYSEISARFAWNPSPEHRVLATWMHAGDSISLVDSDDASLVSFDGTFELRNSLGIVSLDHRFTPREGLTLQSTTAWTRDRSRLSRDFGGVFDHDVISHRYFGRTDLTWAPKSHVVKAGVDLSYHYVESRGVLEDRRAEPTWHNAPLADYDRPTMDVGSSLHYPEASAYLQETWNGPVNLRVGVRGTWVGLHDEVLLSPRAGLSIPLPSGTIPKVSWGLYHNTPRDPQVYDQNTGNPDLHSERAMHTVVGIDQAIPLPGEEAGGLLRVEGYWIALDDLVVNPDNPEAVAAGTTWANDGSGTNRGVDVMVAGRSGRVQGMLTYGYLVAERENPLNTVFPTEFSPAQDQRHTFGATAEFQLSPRWRTTARYAFHTGRPVSTVDLTEAGDSVALSCLNCERMGPFHNIDLRVEWRKAMRNYRLSFYAELLNATHFQSDFIPVVDIEDGALVESMFHHLPIRPFLGVRADF